MSRREHRWTAEREGNSPCTRPASGLSLSNNRRIEFVVLVVDIDRDERETNVEQVDADSDKHWTLMQNDWHSSTIDVLWLRRTSSSSLRWKRPPIILSLHIKFHSSLSGGTSRRSPGRHGVESFANDHSSTVGTRERRKVNDEEGKVSSLSSLHVRNDDVRAKEVKALVRTFPVVCYFSIYGIEIHIHIIAGLDKVSRVEMVLYS